MTTRQRNFRNRQPSYSEDDYDEYVGRSYEDDYGVSPGTYNQYMYHARPSGGNDISGYVTIPELKESQAENPEDTNDDESSFDQLSNSQNLKLNSCLFEVQDVVGDNNVSENHLKKIAVENDFDSERVLKLLLNDESDPSSQITPEATVHTPLGQRDRFKKNRQRSPISTNTTPNFNRSKSTPCDPIQMSMSTKSSSTPSLPKPKDDSLSEVSSQIKHAPALIERVNERLSNRPLNLVVLGHVDAGKSTMSGQLLFSLQAVSEKMLKKEQQEARRAGRAAPVGLAWLMDESGEERTRGVTMDIGERRLVTPKGRHVTLLDAPGHRDFVAAAVGGAARADAAILVIDSSKGAFEAGMGPGQTIEHALVARALGVNSLIVAINKLDAVDWRKDRFDEVVSKLEVFLTKRAGFKSCDLFFVPCSGLTGDNIASLNSNCALLNWYQGPTLVERLEMLPSIEREYDVPLCFSVCNILKSSGASATISGVVLKGIIGIGDKLVLLPTGDAVKVRSVHLDDEKSDVGGPGDHCTCVLVASEPFIVVVGSALCDPSSLVPTCTVFEATIVTLGSDEILARGSNVELFTQSLREPAVVKRVVSLVTKSSSEGSDKKPKRVRVLGKHCSAVIIISTFKPICVDIFKNSKALGRFLLRSNSVSIAAGVINKLIE